jgi:hypothetical protein
VAEFIYESFPRSIYSGEIEASLGLVSQQLDDPA